MTECVNQKTKGEKFMIKAILLDIDGTLTNDKKIITPKTKAALVKVQNAGVRLAIASGRPEKGLYKFARELEMDKNHGIFICYNGARVVDCQSGEVIFSHAMTTEEACAVLNHINNFDVTPIIAKGDYMHTNNVFGCIIDYIGKSFNVIEYESRGNGYLLCEHKNLSEWLDFPVEKILTAGNPDYLKAHYKEMQKPFVQNLNCMFTSDFYFEYTAKGIDKGKAIDFAFKNLSIPADKMIAFGDAQNDISMLKYVGVGVAMGNASEEVKAIADEVTLDNNSDGIAESLCKHFPNLL